ncbi:ABC transporter permease subunit [Streptomonospora sp. S1-112]|uniref:ABC transporter permease subunit n=1 Tax=Streptomonospora mangrovi TaxID=2883123 RepID=A0A9X3NZG7_9ACTN|nr:ABC transporter permease subunit [Streptomonospora mangrovi]MDA0567186.1 ABC transporter permease subunit [Streptomonospora mangrovi]
MGHCAWMRRGGVAARAVAVPLLLTAVLGLALFGGWLAPYDPTETVGIPWRPPDSASPLGTDALGRDVWSRVLAGGAGLVAVAALAAACATAVGVAGGLVAGWFSGAADRALTAVADLMLAVPSLLLALVAAIALPGHAAVVVATVCGGAPMTLRVVRDAVRAVRSSGYVQAARCRGEHPAWILVFEVAPATRGLVAADLGLRLVVALQVASALSVLGFGADPPAPDWALMLRENMAGMSANPWAVAAPAAALGLTTVALALAAQPAAGREGDR